MLSSAAGDRARGIGEITLRSAKAYLRWQPAAHRARFTIPVPRVPADAASVNAMLGEPAASREKAERETRPLRAWARGRRRSRPALVTRCTVVRYRMKPVLLVGGGASRCRRSACRHGVR